MYRAVHDAICLRGLILVSMCKVKDACIHDSSSWVAFSFGRLLPLTQDVPEVASPISQLWRAHRTSRTLKFEDAANYLATTTFTP
jgi:hypothetical protein